MLIVGDVRVVDLGLEVDLRRFEGVFLGEDEEESEAAALCFCQFLEPCGGCDGDRRTEYGDCDGPSRMMFHWWRSDSSTRLTEIPWSGEFVMSPSSCTS